MIRTPSLIDDWFGISYSGPALRALIHGDYTSAHVDFAGRYRPAYTAIWNYAQWHLFGDPSVAVAAAWGALRVAAFLLAIWLLARLTGSRSLAGRPILWLAPVAVALTPEAAVDLVRHGPADPIMVAGLVIGLTLIGVSVRAFLHPETLRRKRMLAVMFSGYLLYLVGVYSKEASICLLAFTPFFVKWATPFWRARTQESRVGRWLLVFLGFSLVAPLVHVAVHLAVATSAASDPYAGVHLSVGRKRLAAVIFPLLGAPGPLGTLLWLAVVPVALAVVIRLLRRHDPDRWLVMGVLVTGFLMSAFSLARGDVPSRYYIPWLVAVAAVASRDLAAARPRVQLAVAILVIGVTLPGTRDALERWTKTEQSGSTAVEMATGVVSAGCSIYVANFDAEREVAIPRLLGLGGRSMPIRKCNEDSTRAYVVSWQSATLPHEFASRCRSHWETLTVRDGVSMSRCQSLRGEGLPDQDEASAGSQVPVVRLRVPMGEPSPRTLFQTGLPRNR